MSFIQTVLNLHARFVNFCSYAQSLALFAVRFWLFKSFFFSGWLKTKNWQSTLFLFEHEYQVPLIPYNIAAYLGTAAEIVLPLLLLLGLFSRLAAIGLFLFNLVIIFSYPHLWTPEGKLGLNDHIMWGIFAVVIIAFGPGKIAVDWVFNHERA